MGKVERIRYEVDPHNRLIAERTGRETAIQRYRQVLDGRFKINPDNSLTYHIKKSQHIAAPQQIKFYGKFSLDKNHNLIFTLDKWSNQCLGNRLIIKTDIIDAKSNELSFSVTTKSPSGQEQVYILKTSGRWQADKYNRLTFNIERERGGVDKLTFEGGWEINKQNQIIYTYTKRHLKRKEKISRVITLKGYWDITDKYRVSYILNKRLSSLFDFKIILINAFRRMLLYKIGIGVIPKKRIMTVFGRWKLNKKLGLLFEIEYERANLKTIIFGTQVKLDKNYNLDFKLKNKLNKDLGIELKLFRAILKNQGKAFIKTLLSRREMTILAGVGIRW